MPFTELEKPVKAGFAPAVLSLDFKVMPRFCRYLLEHKLEEFSRRSLRLSLEVDLPMLRFFKTLLETTPEETLVQMGMESNGAMLTAFAENKTEAFIEKSVDDWINNRITGLERGQVEVDDITLVCYIRKHVFLSLVSGFTADVEQIQTLTDELDRFTLALESACFKTYSSLLTETLKRNERLYKQAQAISRMGNWTWSLATNAVSWTDELYRIYGLEPQSEQISFERFVNFVFPEDVAVVTASIQNALEKRQPFEFTHRIVRDNGDVRVLHAKGEPALLDGEVIGMIGTGQDITEDTERKRSEEKLRESEARFRAVADSAPVLIWMSGTDKLCFYFNKVWLQFTGRSFDEEYGDGWFNGVHPDDRAHCLETYIAGFEKREAFAMEYRLKRHDGQYRWLLDHGVPRYSPDGTFLGFIGSCTDIHERKRMREVLEQKVQERTAELQHANRELERSNAELLSFSYVASHDLQEPLRKIQTFSSRVLDREYDHLSESGRDAFHRINAAAARMKQLIEDLLAYSRTNTAAKVFEPVDLNIVLTELTAAMKEELTEKNALVTWASLPTVNGISFQLYQLFENLIGNSLKYAKPGRPARVHVDCTSVNGAAVANLHAPHTKAYHRITVTDNGIGFDQKHAKKIFEVFQRLHHRDQFPGTGIGLSICKRIVENHGGFISATSEPDNGAVFSVFIPVDTGLSQTKNQLN